MKLALLGCCLGVVLLRCVPWLRQVWDGADSVLRVNRNTGMVDKTLRRRPLTNQAFTFVYLQHTRPSFTFAYLLHSEVYKSQKRRRFGE